MKTQFNIMLTTEFGIGRDKRQVTTQQNAEETFRLMLNKLPKRIGKSWFSMEFEFNGQLIDVSKDHLIETNWDFSNSITVEELGSNECKGCQMLYDKKEVARINGKESSVYYLGYCSALCYTKDAVFS